MHIFTQLFLLALSLGLLIQIWLLWRHKQHVTAHQHQVPPAFADAVSLDEHQKAASYTLARVKAAKFELILSTLLLLAWTLGGGLNWLHQAWDSSTLHWVLTAVGTAFILSSFVIMGAAGYPSQHRGGHLPLKPVLAFNRTTPHDAFIIDHAHPNRPHA